MHMGGRDSSARGRPLDLDEICISIVLRAVDLKMRRWKGKERSGGEAYLHHGIPYFRTCDKAIPV
jgi:hypothetical protein